MSEDNAARDGDCAPSPWRHPAEETEGLYPKLVVSDNRVTGSITIGPSRLPVWAILGSYFQGGWDEVVWGWDYIETEYGFTESDLTGLLYNLMEMRGDFGRLVLALADAERRESHGSGYPPWWRKKKDRKRIGDLLLRCVDALAVDRQTGRLLGTNSGSRSTGEPS